MRVLDAGVDSLYWSAAVPAGDWYAAALEAKSAAQSEGGTRAWRDVRGIAFDVLPHGMGAYEFAARAAEMDLRFTDKEHIPSVFVQLRSEFIRTVGVEAAAAESVAVVETLTGAPVLEPKAARVDVFADFADFRLVAADRAGFHTRAEVASYFQGGDVEGMPSVRVGAGRFKLRVYDKRRELAKRARPDPVGWEGFIGDVTRVEVEADVGALRRFKIVTLADALTSYGDLWRYGTRKFFVLREPGSGSMRSWPVRPEWRSVQEAGLRFPADGLVPFSEASGDKVRVLRVLYGSLISLGAHLNAGELADVVKVLPAQVEVIRRGRLFSDEVRRRRRRLPRAVREGMGE